MLRGRGDAAAIQIVMEILPDAVDYGDAPSFIATDICRMFFVSPNIVRITFVRTDVRHDGTEERRVSGHVDCDIAQMIHMNATIRDALPRLMAEDPSREPPRDDGSPTAH
jgi:hypothetical protein